MKKKLLKKCIKTNYKKMDLLNDLKMLLLNFKLCHDLPNS